MPKYELKIDLNVLNHLGINLYSTVPAVLSELIANAWDADATEVRIENFEDRIIIKDNGCGMAEEEFNNKFLNVGYQRRKNSDEDLTPQLNRQVMGRKGIGKLSIFSIANHIEIYTKQSETIAISMKVSDIRRSMLRKETYYPTELKVNDSNKIKSETGTTIVLKEIMKRVQSSIGDNLKKRVARRFDIWGDNFKVLINGDEVSIEDRNYFHKLEFALLYGDYPQSNFKHIPSDKLIKRDSALPALSKNSEVCGWIGLVKESDKLQEGPDNLNKISVLTRGKVALEDIFELYRDGGMYTKYIIGEIRADFLDLTEKDDIATSSRQNFIQNDKRFIELKKFIEHELKFIKSERSKYKLEEGGKKAEEIPAIKKWLGSLTPDAKSAAQKLFGRINQIATDEEDRKTLYKHGVLAFEHLHHKDKLQQLDNLGIESLEIAVKLFSELDDIEASWYYQITKGRLEAIKTLKEHIATDQIEKVVQKHICDHLWLLDPSWDRATEHPAMEKSIKNALDQVYLTKSEKSGRIDIYYKKISGKHVIIELKRSSVTPKSGELEEQVKKYQRAVTRQLKAYKETGLVEVVCLVGKGLSGWNDNESKQTEERALSEHHIKVVTYQQLIKDAEISYRAYLEKEQETGRIQKLLQEIDNIPEQ